MDVNDEVEGVARVIYETLCDGVLPAHDYWFRSLEPSNYTLTARAVLDYLHAQRSRVAGSTP